MPWIAPGDCSIPIRLGLNSNIRNRGIQVIGEGCGFTFRSIRPYGGNGQLARLLAQGFDIIHRIIDSANIGTVLVQIVLLHFGIILNIPGHIKLPGIGEALGQSEACWCCRFDSRAVRDLDLSDIDLVVINRFVPFFKI
ncbi:hypothetical protein D3C81_1363860 [compost metagenome]